MKNQITELFTESITEQGIKDIIAKHDPAIVRDMTNDAEFKEARKIRTEMNKLLENIDRIGIDAATDLKQVREDLKARVESAYAPTVTPFLIEDAKRKAEQKAIAEAKKARIAEQELKIESIRGASNRAMHLPLSDLEDILNDVCNTDLNWFDDDFRGGAQIAKEVAIGQLNDAFKYLSEKEEARKLAELKESELADKNDEIAKLKALLNSQVLPEEDKDPEQAHEYRVAVGDLMQFAGVNHADAESVLNAIKSNQITNVTFN